MPRRAQRRAAATGWKPLSDSSTGARGRSGRPNSQPWPRSAPSAVTSSAIGCAASQGDASACPSSYFWEPVAGADGKEVVDKIAQHPDGPGWLLDPRIKRVEIGWKATGGGGWECAVLATY